MASPIRRSGRLQLAEIKKRPKVHAEHVDLGEDDEDSVEDGGANGNENAGSDVSGDDEVSGGDDDGSVDKETDSDDAFEDPPRKTSTDPSPSTSRKNAGTEKKRKRQGITKLKEKIKLTELPAKLGFWVVDKFNPRSSSLELADGTKVRVTVNDIRHVLGLPCGRLKVLSKKKGEKCDILEQLRVEIGMRDNRISPLELSEKVLQYTDGGVWFCRLFVLLVVSVLVESPSHGYVNNWVLKSLEDVDGIAQLNWCEYVHRSLTDSRVKWEKGNRKYYTGPLLCLMVFYVDRVVLYSRDVERMSLAFLGWTSKILRDRENNEVKAGGFGLGYDDGRFLGEVMDVSSGDAVVGACLEQVNVKTGNGDTAEPMGEARDDPVEVFVQKFAEKGKVLATTIIDLVSLIESAPPGTMENDVFKQLQHAAGRLLGLAQRRGGLMATEEAVLARSKYKKIMEDMPSFSLGFSQMDGVNENVNIDGGDIGAFRNTPSTPAVRVVNEPESNPVVENVFITPEEVHYRVGDAVDRDLAGESRNQPDRLGMAAVAGVSAVGDVTVPGTDPVSSKAVNPNAPKDEAVFVKDGFELTRGEIASLDIGKHISKRVIDVWSIILNHNEKFRSEESPLRVFARSMDCVANGDIVDVSEANVKNMFANALLPAWDEMADDFNWGKAELNWAYVLCVDLKSRRCDILDSSSAKAKTEDRYGDMPKRVVRLLGDFLEQQRFVYKGKCVREMVAKRITFPWRDPKATFDYGVATMRHMETYMGDGGKGWNCGLSRLNLKPLMALRCKYCACILLSPINALLDKVYEESEKLERERKEKGPK
ncbi:unnamed protein product [Cuscuta campestris]|uniref:Ubiquitin-like protease family profile domain-containing protein n=1 Tax=Cuscuta campestris TaxID=132261 RepID=A0A484LCA9_9ASTE|nr:unnamed protein product [Cuscuta campestris]